MSWTGKPTSLLAYRYLTAADIEEIVAQIDVLTEVIDPAWVAWTPTLTNLTLGNGTLSCAYKSIGKTVHYRFKMTFGTTSSMGSGPSFTLPVAPVSTYSGSSIGDINLVDTGIAERRGVARNIAGAAPTEIIGYSTSGVGVTVTSTVPHTWGTGDVIGVIGTYEAA